MSEELLENWKMAEMGSLLANVLLLIGLARDKGATFQPGISSLMASHKNRGQAGEGRAQASSAGEQAFRVTGKGHKHLSLPTGSFRDAVQ